MKDFQHEQLFTELTPEQAAVREGGKTLRLYSITCNKAGTDLFVKDEAYFVVLGRKVGSGSMGSGEYRSINKGGRGFEGSISVALYNDAPNRSPTTG